MTDPLPSNPTPHAHWQGRHVEAEVLVSYAGIATQILLTTGKHHLLLDCGDGTIRDVLGLDSRNLAGIAITHGHYDHLGGVWSLLGCLRTIGRKGTISIVSPPGCVELDTILEGFDHHYRASCPYTIVRQTTPPASRGRRTW